jgi:mycothiol synthase
MRLLDAYSLRAPVWDDLGAIAAVLAGGDGDDAGETVLDEGFVRNGWGRPGFDLATDAWVGVDGAGTVVGYARVAAEEPDVVESWGVVHPDHRGRGLGTALLDRIEERAGRLLPDLETVRFRHAIDADDDAAAALLRGRGLRLVRHFWHMQVELAGPVEPGPSPAGIAIAGICSPDDLPDVHGVLETAFADHWDHAPRTYERWVDDEASGPDYDPSLWLAARAGGVVVGALTASVMGDHGWVGLLGVAAPYRGRGIAPALLRRSFAGFAARGVDRVVLAVDAGNASAAAVYERAGMSVVKRWDLWERQSSRRRSASIVPSGRVGQG